MSYLRPIPEKAELEAGVIRMLRVNMGLRAGEKLMLLSDIPTRREWKNNDPEDILKAVATTFLGRTVAEIAREAFRECRVDFYPYWSLGRSGVEPSSRMSGAMLHYNVILAINAYSLTHTQAREAACSAGARVATMRGAVAEMFEPDGSISVDYLAVEKETLFLADFLTQAHEARVVTDHGTDLTFSLKGRKGGADTGIYVKPGSWGNLPAGEAYIAPLEGTAKGNLVIPRGWFAGLDEEMVLTFKAGQVESIQGGGRVRQKLDALLGLGSHGKKRKDRCNLAELGIGTNPKAQRIDITIEAEKIKGTIHIGIGDNAHMGGNVTADYHQDFVVPKPRLFLDGEKVMDQGLWVRQ
jgi:aminopeptidase